MADNFTLSGVTFGSKDVGGAQNQKIVNVSVWATATVTSVAASLTSVQLVASQVLRRGLYIYNDSLTRLRIKYGTAASANSLTAIIEAGGFYEMPTQIYSGVIHGIWDAEADGTVDSNGAARITELTE